MNICVVNQPWNPAIPPVESGSIAIWTYEVAKRLTRSCRVVVYSKSVPGEPERREVDGAIYSRCSDEPNPYRIMSRVRHFIDSLHGNRLPHFAKNSYYAAYFRRVAEMIREDDPDVVHLHNFGQAASVIRAAHPRVRIVLHMHCEWLSQLPQAYVMEWLTQVDAIIGCSDHIVRKICTAFPEVAQRCHTVHNGINTDLFKPEGESQSLGEPGEQAILFVGRLTPEKGLHVLIDAFGEVIKRNDAARLFIVGPDSYTSKQFLVDLSNDPLVKNLARFYKTDYMTAVMSSATEIVRSRTALLGEIPNHQLPGFYRSAHVLANPSLSESFGLTLAESMACGVPVVATNVGGMPEVLGGEDCGLMCAAGNKKELASCLLNILQYDGRRAEMSQNAANRAAKLFSWSKIARDTCDVYRAVLSQ